MKTLVIGASTHDYRYSNKAIKLLRAYKHEVVAVGREQGSVSGVEIDYHMPEANDIDTVTLYINPTHQQPYYDKLVALKPRRVIFNPGTENPQLEEILQQNGITTEEACTLVLLNTGQY
jgi:predicted CoA-binding protein